MPDQHPLPGARWARTLRHDGDDDDDDHDDEDHDHRRDGDDDDDGEEITTTTALRASPARSRNRKPPPPPSSSKSLKSPKKSKASLKREAQREEVLKRVRAHLRRGRGGGGAIVPVADFKALLRAAGIKNASVRPWLHEPPPDQPCFGTHFEADDYDSPAFVCLGAKSHTALSPRFELQSAR